MKLILLRHEERGINIDFFSELTENGIKKSFLLSDILNQYNIDIIFSSPFIRTLQTIYPFCIKYNKKVNIEYGLYEYLHNPLFFVMKWYYTINDIKDKYLKNIINTNYESCIDLDNLYVLEDEENLEKRIIIFINTLKTKYHNKTILLVTHKGIINKIKDIYVTKTGMDDTFEMGSLEVYKI